ncbi:Glutathione S-transferase zeta class [Patulibacter medicamentivorans]|uniref:Glutathione S-transferase zeta class n=1 Tax=Patulibacter medicamentivorans TaxID=1097667 RepID=H0EBM2_9ACTN|nr:glutathione S-transferase N-terminal domain-containing protein [Patulibacter medicamentivorans]EHN08915.1 Glutathione S-transferase zeta class [Patulibacter medicamentivorans]
MPATAPQLTLHALPPSHPCLTVEAALRLKGLEFERIDLSMTARDRPEQVAAIYGEGRHTVPGLLIDGEPVHGSRAILARIEALAPDVAPLFPEPIADAVREAERWGDDELQDLGRRLPWGALHFRPEALNSLVGGAPLDPAGTDFAIKFAHVAWKYHGITAVRLHEDLAGLPAKIERIERFAQEGTIGGEQPNAADLQIGATIRILLAVGDLRPLLAGTTAEAIATRFLPPATGEIPAGAYPAGWVPAR